LIYIFNYFLTLVIQNTNERQCCVSRREIIGIQVEQRERSYAHQVLGWQPNA